MSAVPLRELKDWNIKRKWKRKGKTPPHFHAVFECTKYNLTSTIWGSRGAVAKYKILQLSTKETKSFAPVLHQKAIKFKFSMPPAAQSMQRWHLDNHHISNLIAKEGQTPYDWLAHSHVRETHLITICMLSIRKIKLKNKNLTLAANDM